MSTTFGNVVSFDEVDRARLDAITQARIDGRNGRAERFPGQVADRERIGVYGERAAAVVMGYAEHWPTTDPFGETSDLPGGEQVRAASGPHYGLCVRPEDRPHADRPHLLVVPYMDGWRVPGWIMGRDAMADRYWRTDVAYPCWIVPQSDLRLLEGLG